MLVWQYTASLTVQYANLKDIYFTGHGFLNDSNFILSAV